MSKYNFDVCVLNYFTKLTEENKQKFCDICLSFLQHHLRRVRYVYDSIEECNFVLKKILALEKIQDYKESPEDNQFREWVLSEYNLYLDDSCSHDFRKIRFLSCALGIVRSFSIIMEYKNTDRRIYEEYNTNYILVDDYQSKLAQSWIKDYGMENRKYTKTEADELMMVGQNVFFESISDLVEGGGPARHKVIKRMEQQTSRLVQKLLNQQNSKNLIDSYMRSGDTFANIRHLLQNEKRQPGFLTRLQEMFMVEGDGEKMMIWDYISQHKREWKRRER